MNGTPINWDVSVRRVLRASVQRALDDEATATSLLYALDVLTEAERLWADRPSDPENLSLGGMLPGGIAFGLIARPTTAGGIEWTFHS